MNSMKIEAEYIFDREFSPEERAEVENDVLDVLDGEIRSARFVKAARNQRFMCTRYDLGGEISVTVDVELSFLGKILGKIGIV